MSILEMTTVATNGFTALIILSTVIVALVGLKMDHKRRRKQSTLEYMNRIREKYNPLNNELRRSFSGGALNQEEVDRIISHSALRDKVRDLLGIFEQLAVGANDQVFDVELINRMSGGYIIAIYVRYFPYIQNRRQSTGPDSLFEEFQNLVTKIKRIRTKQTGETEDT